MFRHRNRLIATAGAALATAAMVVSGALAASATTTATATEHFQIANDNPTSNKNPLIAYGAFTAHGTDIEGNHNLARFVFRNGTLKIKHSNGKGTQKFNPRTCLLRINERGTYKVLGGTGAYRGASGHGTYHLQILAIAARKGGKCVTKQNVPPAAFQQIIQASGPFSR
jgi:hypothetical protein